MAQLEELVAAARAAYPIRSEASTALSALGAEAVPPVLEAYRADEDTAHGVLWRNVLAEMERAQIVPLLCDALAAEESISAQHGLMALLGTSDDPRAVEPLTQRLGDYMRSAAVEALGALRLDAALHALRLVCDELLGGDDPGAGLDALVEELRDEEDAERVRLLITLAESLAKHGDHSLANAVCRLSAFDRGAADPFWEAYVVRQEAVRALQLVVCDDTLRSLGEALGDPDPEVVENAIDACRYLGARACAATLVAALDTEDPVNRQRAADALRGLFGPDLDPDEAEFAALCLGRASSLAGHPCVRFGTAARVSQLLDALGALDSLVPASIEFRLITGVDLLGALSPEWALDRDVEGRARRWWETASDRFEAGRLYRYGALLEPIWAR